jgi:hypothetical protein
MGRLFDVATKKTVAIQLSAARALYHRPNIGDCCTKSRRFDWYPPIFWLNNRVPLSCKTTSSLNLVLRGQPEKVIC